MRIGDAPAVHDALACAAALAAGEGPGQLRDPIPDRFGRRDRHRPPHSGLHHPAQRLQHPGRRSILMRLAYRSHNRTLTQYL